MRSTGGLLDLWAAIKQDRHAAGLPTVGGSARAPGAFAPVPLAEAAARSEGKVLLGMAPGVDLLEAAVPADFPNALGNTLYRELIRSYGLVEETWRAYVRIGENNDFRPKFEILASEFEDLLAVPTGTEYKDSLMTDAFYTITLAVFGRLFSVNRETIINDDIGLLRDTPGRMARAVARTLNKFVVRSILEANVPAYDGVTLFNASHNNLITGATSALSGTSLQTAIYTMQNNVGDPNLNPSGGPMGLSPQMLVVPPALEFVAKQLVQSALVVVASGTNATQPNVQYGNVNPLQNIVNVVVERWLIGSQVAWYLFANPTEAPAIQVNFLRGRPNPDLLMERPYMADVMGGGEDPYEVEIDRVVYKTRHQYGGTAATYWGALKAAGQ